MDNVFKQTVLDSMSAALPGCECMPRLGGTDPIDYIVVYNGVADRLAMTDGEVGCNGLDPQFIAARCKTVAMRFNDV